MTDKERLVENFMTVIPTMHKRLMKGFSTIGIPKQQLWLLFHIDNEDGKRMSFYSNKMMIPKSNITLIAEKLIEDGLVERAFSEEDRRVITLKITEKGKEYLAEHRKRVKNEMMAKLDMFDETEIKRLNELLEEMRVILNKNE